MAKWILACGAFALLGAQAKAPGNPDMKYIAEWGISVMRPPKPKNEEWDLKDSPARLAESKLSVSHKVDEVVIDFVMVAPRKDEGFTSFYFDPKAEAEGVVKGIASSQNFKDAKQKGAVRPQKLPGNAASGVSTYYVEVTCKDKDDKPLEWRVWSFVAKESRCLVMAYLICSEGLYAKYGRELQYILSSIKTYKIDKK